MERKSVFSAASLITLILLTVLLTVSDQAEKHITPVSAIRSTGYANLTMRNPAAVYCLDIMGYQYKLLDTPGGGQIGICVLPNGEECDEWAFYAGMCAPSYSYCAQKGYRVETRNDGKDPFAPRYAVCLSPDGRVVGSVAQLSNLQIKLKETINCGAYPWGEKAVPDNSNPPPPYEQPSVPAGGFPPYLPPLQPNRHILPARSISSLPPSFDWRNYQEHNWLTDVKNQGSCGSCWAFAAVGVVEAYHNILSSNPDLDLDLAEQDLVSCSDAGSCNGGQSDLAMLYIRNTGIVDENCLPYTASDSSCNKCGDWQNRLTYVDEASSFTPTPLSIQQSIVDHGPLYVYMGIGSDYGGYFDGNGIYRCSDDSGINHAVVIVGYNDDGGYWIVRNSWGSSWGDNGYFKVGYGECSIDGTYAGYAYNIPPDGQIISPSEGAFLNGDSVYIEAEASDNNYVNQVHFFAWYDNDWHYIGSDTDGSNNYQTIWDISGLSDQSGIWLDAVIYDRVVNRSDAMVGNLTLDRTPPTATAHISPMYGDAPFLDFYVWWDGLDNLSGIASYDVQYRDGSDGTWTDLLINTTDTSYRFVGQNGHTYYFRARAHDNAGNNGAYATGDGDAQYTVQICPTSADSSEPDDIYTAARTISTDGTWQFHNFHVAGDQDWVKFYAATGVTYTLATTNTGGHADTVLYLYDLDGSTVITSNDDYPGMWPASRLDWQPAISGVYYAMVNHWDEYAYGCTTGYGLSIITNDETPPTGSVIINEGATYASSQVVTLTLTATDIGAGVDQMMIANSSDFSSATWVAYSDSLAWTLLAGDGLKAVYAKFRDRAGNVSPVYSDTIILDMTPPTGSVIADEGATYASSQVVTLTLTATDTGAGVGQMMIANSSDFSSATWVAYSDSLAWTLLAGDGLKAVYAKFRDRAGNVSPVYSDTIILDTTPPTGTIVINGGALYASQVTVTLTLSAQDAGSGLNNMRFSNDNANWSEWESYAASKNWTLTGADGYRTVYVQFRDTVGNISTYSDTITLDREPPSSRVLPLPAQSSASFTVSWSGSDATSGIATYDVQVRDGLTGSWATWLSDTTSTSAIFTGVEGHAYYFRSRARDRAGNLEEWPTDPNGDTFTQILWQVFLPLVVRE